MDAFNQALNGVYDQARDAVFKLELDAAFNRVVKISGIAKGDSFKYDYVVDLKSLENRGVLDDGNMEQFEFRLTNMIIAYMISIRYTVTFKHETVNAGKEDWLVMMAKKIS